MPAGRPRTPVGTHGKVSTTRLDSGQWRAETRVRDADGASRVVRGTGSTRAKAGAALQARIASRPRSMKGPVTASTTVAVLSARWLREISDDGSRAPRSIEQYESAVRLKVLPALGELAVGEVTAGVVTRWLRDLPNRQKVARTVLSQVLDLAVLDGAIAINPVRVAPRVTRKPEPGTRRAGPRSVRGSEMQAVRNAITAWERSAPNKTTPLRDAMLLELLTGTRISETLAIRWVDVDLDRGVVAITGALVPVKGVGLVRVDTKTEAGDRDIHGLPPAMIDRLRTILSERPPGTEGSIAPVLSSQTGGWLWPNNVRRAWREARSASPVDLSWVTPHTLRKTAGSAVADAVGVLAASRFLGHSDTRVTERHYLDRKTDGPDIGPILDGLADGW